MKTVSKDKKYLYELDESVICDAYNSLRTYLYEDLGQVTEHIVKLQNTYNELENKHHWTYYLSYKVFRRHFLFDKNSYVKSMRMPKFDLDNIEVFNYRYHHEISKPILKNKNYYLTPQYFTHANYTSKDLKEVWDIMKNKHSKSGVIYAYELIDSKFWTVKS